MADFFLRRNLHVAREGAVIRLNTALEETMEEIETITVVSEKNSAVLRRALAILDAAR